jgi:hypothetical protein
MKIFSHRISMDGLELTPTSEQLFKASVIVVCAWAMMEAPLELGDSIGSTWLLAMVTSKVLMGLIGTVAIADLRVARQVVAFVFGASAFAITPALPVEYMRCVAIAFFSTVACLGKAACVASLRDRVERRKA